MKILITGPTGLLGHNLIRLLVSEGHRIRAIVQPQAPVNFLLGLDIEIIPCDIVTDTALLDKAMEGCDAVIHTAALTTVSPARSPLHRLVNVQGAINVMEAALKNNVKRYIHVGTANSFGYGSAGRPGTESCAYNSGKYGLDYTDSKLEAQQIVLDYVKSRGLSAIVVNPTYMIGPYDAKPSSGAMIVAVCTGKLKGYSPGGKNCISVKDVSRAISNALTHGKIGECYILGNENLTYKALFEKVARSAGVDVPSLKIPALAVKAWGLAGSLYERVAKRKTMLNYPMARIACDCHYFNAEKAVRELGLPQTPLEQAIEEAIQWFASNGYIKKRVIYELMPRDIEVAKRKTA
jgi:dihydroflavonol-4-reductase